MTLQRTDLPTFFSRIWGRTLATVTATAVAEAYNPGQRTGRLSADRAEVREALLVANQDPKGAGAAPIVDPASGVPWRPP